MKRTHLKKGTSLQFDIEEYRIDGFLGEGANCLVYNAHLMTKGVQINVRIKELYPAKAHINRKKDELIWLDLKEKDVYFARFNDTFVKHVRIQNEMVNTTAHITDEIKKLNNTLYIIINVDEGRTFDQEENLRFGDVLQTIIALAKTIGDYHKRGYVHLDIKPENFLVVPETREYVKIIDVDTVGKISDIRSNKLEHISYSAGWASPELELKETAQIGPASDIYSIVAILFQRIFGSRPGSIDRSSIKKWNIDKIDGQEYLPSVKKELIDLFKKGLNNSIEKRYQSTEMLVNDLEHIKSLVEKKQFIKSSYVQLTNLDSMVGREAEINDIYEVLKTKRAVFLCGFGGIGKTTIAQKYIERYRDYYDAIVYYRYLGNLAGFISYVPIENNQNKNNVNETEKFSEGEVNEKKAKDDSKKIEQMRLLKELSSEKVLFIIDNFDTNEDELLEEVLSIGAKFIFTTRIKEQNINSDEVEFVDIGKLSTEDCLMIIENEIGKLDNSELEAASEIIERYENHTYLVALVAKYLKKSGESILELSDSIKNVGISTFGEDSDTVSSFKDGKNSPNKSVLEHLGELFRVFDLTEEEIETVENIFWITRRCILKRSYYKKYTGAKNFNSLDKLVEIGLVQEEVYNAGRFSSDSKLKDKKYSLHPILAEFFITLHRDKEKSMVYQLSKKYCITHKDDWKKEDNAYIHLFLTFIDDSIDHSKSGLCEKNAIEDVTIVRDIMKTLFENDISTYYDLFDYRIYFQKTFQVIIQNNENYANDFFNAILAVKYYDYFVSEYSGEDKEDRVEIVIRCLIDINKRMLVYLNKNKVRRNKENDTVDKSIINSLYGELRIINCEAVFIEFPLSEIYWETDYRADILCEGGLWLYEDCDSNGFPIFPEPNYPGDEGIGIIKYVKEQSEMLFADLLTLIKTIRYIDIQQDIRFLEIAEKSIEWKLSYLDGTVLDPFEVYEDYPLIKQPLLFFSDRSLWEERILESFETTIACSSHRIWIYKLLLNIYFLLEQSIGFIQKLKGLSLFDKIYNDDVISEIDKESLLFDYLPDNGHELFFSYEGYNYNIDKTAIYPEIAGFYAEISDLLWNKIYIWDDVNTDRNCKILLYLIVEEFRSYNTIKLKNNLEIIMLNASNAKYIEYFSDVARFLNERKYIKEATFLLQMILNNYKVDLGMYQGKKLKENLNNALVLEALLSEFPKMEEIEKQYGEYAKAIIEKSDFLNRRKIDNKYKLRIINLRFEELNERMKKAFVIFLISGKKEQMISCLKKAEKYLSKIEWTEELLYMSGIEEVEIFMDFIKPFFSEWGIKDELPFDKDFDPNPKNDKTQTLFFDGTLTDEVLINYIRAFSLFKRANICLKNYNIDHCWNSISKKKITLWYNRHKAKTINYDPYEELEDILYISSACRMQEINFNFIMHICSQKKNLEYFVQMLEMCRKIGIFDKSAKELIRLYGPKDENVDNEEQEIDFLFETMEMIDLDRPFIDELPFT
ncbi:MAG: protein kinase [Lachnospiraceae bacterium]|nr:protein kinase [Lachnospiraceae bacterium]